MAAHRFKAWMKTVSLLPVLLLLFPSQAEDWLWQEDQFFSEGRQDPGENQAWVMMGVSRSQCLGEKDKYQGQKDQVQICSKAHRNCVSMGNVIDFSQT